MRFKRVLALAAAIGILGAADAQAIYGPQAVRQIRRYVAEDCRSYPGFDCLNWEVFHCYKLGRRKVRCSSIQRYSHNGNFRECRFKTSAVEARNHSIVYLHFGRVRCFSASGAEI